MYAVVEIAGTQCKVVNNDTIRVPRIEQEPGKSIVLDRVLLIVDNKKINVGEPVVPNAKVSATVVSHGKAKKVMVFKKKRRKDYRVKKGHRQPLTIIRIESI